VALGEKIKSRKEIIVQIEPEAVGWGAISPQDF